MTQENLTNLWSLYEKGLSYQNKIGLRQNIPMYVKFFEGEQWPAATENTKNLPRPVINIIKMICRNKKAALMSAPVRLVYESDRQGVDIDKFNHFSSYIQKEMRLDEVDKNAVDDGVKKGSYFQHFYWDTSAIGKDGAIEGGIRVELIDPLDIFFENPNVLDEQKQGWILISSRESINSIKAKADEDVDLKEIVADAMESNPYNTTEQDEDLLCTLLTRYFKKEGKVYCEKATRRVVINKPFAIIPDLNAAREELGMEERSKAPIVQAEELYPIVAGYYEKKEKCIYGLSEVQGLIANQKSINFHIAMVLLNAQETSWGKYIALPNALKGQKITNAPGQVLIDYSGTGTGIRKMTEQTIHNTSLDAVNVLTNLTRSSSGATEVMSGETLGANMSGTAIAYLQAQAQGPIEDLRRTYWMFKQKQGKVLAQFYRNFYLDKDFTYEMVDKDTDEKQKAHNTFNSAEYTDVNFSVVVEAVSGTRSSAASDINMLETLLKLQAIDVETFISLYPDNAIGNKNQILEHIRKSKNSENNVLREQVSQLNNYIKELSAVIERQDSVVKNIVPIVNENRKVKEAYAKLANEARVKITQANKQISVTNDIMKSITEDTKELSMAYLNAKGEITEQ